MVGLTLRKARASCPTFLEAKACEAEVRRLSLVLIGGVLPPGDAGVASVAWLYGKLGHTAAGWQQWGERGRVAAVGGRSGFAQLLRRLLELPDHVAASIELAQFVAADVDSLA